LIEKFKRHFLETAVCIVIILLLSIGSYSRNKLWNDEIGLWIDCVKKSPGKARPYINLAVAYFNAGAYDKSIESNQKAIQIDSKSGQAYYNLGLVYQKRGELTKAIAMEKMALEVDPSLDLAYYSLGGFYFENGQYGESEKAYQRYLKTYPFSPDVHNLLAIVYAAQKKFDQAVTELEWEVRINPNHALAHVNLGQIYWYEFRNRQKAIYHFKSALMLDPLLPHRGEIRRLVRQLEGLP
jgi:tetratricopeptide (TPR) repeat protein